LKHVEELLSSNATLNEQFKDAVYQRNALTSRIETLELDNVDERATEQETTNLRPMLEELEARNQQLAEKCREYQDEIDQLNEKLRSSQFYDDTQETEAEMEVLRERLSLQKERAAAGEERVRELEETCERLEAELSTARLQQVTAEASLEANKTFKAAVDELDASRHSQLGKAREAERHIEELEAELREKTRLVTILESSVSDLRYQLETSTSKLDESATNALHFSHGELLSIQEAEEQQLVPATDESLKMLDADAEDVECLRSHIVSLARALERSENSRAEAIGRLVSEREAHANSLRRMSESVKRFYSTIGPTNS
jgi:predicted RNase H-like nuclease (RuvC/YqgF family)